MMEYRLSIEEYDKWKDESLLVDIRDAGSYQYGYLPGAVNLPAENLLQMVDNLYPIVCSMFPPDATFFLFSVMLNFYIYLRLFSVIQSFSHSTENNDLLRLLFCRFSP